MELDVQRKIDELGRIVVPLEVRRYLKVREGEPVRFFLQDGRVCVEKAPAPDVR